MPLQSQKKQVLACRSMHRRNIDILQRAMNLLVLVPLAMNLLLLVLVPTLVRLLLLLVLLVLLVRLLLLVLLHTTS